MNVHKYIFDKMDPNEEAAAKAKIRNNQFISLREDILSVNSEILKDYEGLYDRLNSILTLIGEVNFMIFFRGCTPRDFYPQTYIMEIKYDAHVWDYLDTYIQIRDDILSVDSVLLSDYVGLTNRLNIILNNLGQKYYNDFFKFVQPNQFIESTYKEVITADANEWLYLQK